MSPEQAPEPNTFFIMCKRNDQRSLVSLTFLHVLPPSSSFLSFEQVLPSVTRQHEVTPDRQTAEACNGLL